MDDFLIEKLIPPFRSEEIPYIDSLTKYLDNYITFVKNHIKTDSYIIGKIKDLNENILSAITDIKNANTLNAYDRINNFIQNEFINLDLPIFTLNLNKPLIRLRYSEKDLIYRKEIFHIPFSQRHNVSQQRYSIPGVPCLYLSGCAFTAWLELNKPNFSNLWCAGYRAKQDLNVLDCAIRLDSIIKEKNNVGKLIFYPLVIATSFATKYPTSPFKEEYLISNILLQTVINTKKIQGIRYFSTKISNYKADYGWMASNIVLPATSEGDEFDEVLSSSLILTYPQPCAALMHSPNSGDVIAMGMFGMDEEDNRKEYTEGPTHFESKIYEWYQGTQFFNIDGYIRSDLSYDSIENTSAITKL